MTSPAKARTLSLFLGRGGLMALTVHPEGSNLPRSKGPWRKIGDIGNADEVAYLSIAAKGYYLLESATKHGDGSNQTPAGHPTRH